MDLFDPWCAMTSPVFALHPSWADARLEQAQRWLDAVPWSGQVGNVDEIEYAAVIVTHCWLSGLRQRLGWRDDRNGCCAVAMDGPSGAGKDRWLAENGRATVSLVRAIMLEHADVHPRTLVEVFVGAGQQLLDPMVLLGHVQQRHQDPLVMWRKDLAPLYEALERFLGGESGVVSEQKFFAVFNEARRFSMAAFAKTHATQDIGSYTLNHEMPPEIHAIWQSCNQVVKQDTDARMAGQTSAKGIAAAMHLHDLVRKFSLVEQGWIGPAYVLTETLAYLAAQACHEASGTCQALHHGAANTFFLQGVQAWLQAQASSRSPAPSSDPAPRPGSRTTP